MAVRELLIETLAHIPPASALDGLTPAAGRTARARREPFHRGDRGAPELLGDVVLQPVRGHQCADGHERRARLAGGGAGSWPELHRQFLSTLERAAALGEDPRSARVTDRSADRVPAARELHDPRRARARRQPQRAPPGTGHRLAAGHGPVAAAVRQLDVVTPFSRPVSPMMEKRCSTNLCDARRSRRLPRRCVSAQPQFSDTCSRLHQGRRARRGADQRPGDRRHRRAGAREPDRHHQGTATSRPSATAPAWSPPAGATTLDLAGRSVIPGLVMVHEHLYYPAGPGVYGQLGESFIRLYLAGGVTTMRTGGNVNGFMDLKLKRLIDAGQKAGPAIDATAPYLNGANTLLADARSEGARRCPAAGGVLGRRGRDVVQGLHADQPRRATRGDRGGAQARPEDHRSPLLGDLRRSRRARHRQPGARVPGGHRLRRRQAARRLPGAGARAADRCGARRERRAVQGARQEARSIAVSR